MEVGGSWAVQYADGTTYTRFREDGSENTWSHIRWAEVVRVAFASADAEAEFEFRHPGPDYDVRLVSRKGMKPMGGDGVTGVRTWLVVTHLAGQPVTEASVKGVFFWFPDGSTHACDQLNCPDAQAYLHALVHGMPVPPLPFDHARLPVGATAALA